MSQAAPQDALLSSYSDEHTLREFALMNGGKFGLHVHTSKYVPVGGARLEVCVSRDASFTLQLDGREEVQALHTMLGNALQCMDAARAQEQERVAKGLPAWDAEFPF